MGSQSSTLYTSLGTLNLNPVNLEFSSQAKHSRDSTEYSNQTVKEIDQGVHEL